MPTIIIPNGILTVPDGPWEIEVDGRTYLFEWGNYGGPTPLNKDWSVKQSRVPNAFYDAATLWDKQGRECKDTGGEYPECVWKPEPKPKQKLKHLGGKHYLVVKEKDA